MNNQPIITPPPAPTPAGPSKFDKNKSYILIIAVALVLVGVPGWWAVNSQGSRPKATATPEPSISTSATPAATIPVLSSTSLKLDPNKNYGNKYAGGILPVGDKKYVTTSPKVGYIYVCRVPQGGGGAGSRGPWFSADGTTYDLNKKAAVAGSVKWQASYNMSVSGSQRIITTNDLPEHVTGVYPVQTSDPAYVYDRNPNSIGAQSFTYTLPAKPTVQAPGCMGGESGIMTTGVALFDGFDAGGRDAGAWEVQDGCSGHPQNTHEYHYHTLSKCITDTSVQTVIGYALDGFPITGPKVGEGNILTTSDLDECHGITSNIMLDGQMVTSYHYVMTQDFPYSISCFKGNAIRPPR